MNNERKNKMKWWGWGDISKNINVANRSGVWLFISKWFGVKYDPKLESTRDYIKLDLSNLALPIAKQNVNFLASLSNFLDADQIAVDDLSRLTYGLGKSYRDLYRIRANLIKALPDIILFPKTVIEVQQIVACANELNIVLIPYGGGTNIVGGVEVSSLESRFVATVSLERIKNISIDTISKIARIEAGCLGPELEQKLQAQGYTLGHFPDSFEYSSVGGWVATRSAGMQSDAYGKMEDMVLSLKIITPRGEVVTRNVPRAANGIDIKHLLIGSEGTLGIIVEVTVIIQKILEYHNFYGFLFNNYSNGTLALRQAAHDRILPVVTRLNDTNKTSLSFAFKEDEKGYNKYIAKFFKKILEFKYKINWSQSCLLITKFEASTKKDLNEHYNKFFNIVKRYNGIALGRKPGKSFENSKYDFPYLRDYIMDYGIVADVCETATTWDNISLIYDEIYKNINGFYTKNKIKGWLGCHISHNYSAGASLYFTFAFVPSATHKTLTEYQLIKNLIESIFVANGATVSHHHAVGYEHSRWLKEELGEVAYNSIKSIKNYFDPNNIMNPNKIITKSNELENFYN